MFYKRRYQSMVATQNACVVQQAMSWHCHVNKVTSFEFNSFPSVYLPRKTDSVTWEWVMGKSCKVVVCGQAAVGKTAVLEQLLYANHVAGKLYLLLCDNAVPIISSDNTIELPWVHCAHSCWLSGVCYRLVSHYIFKMLSLIAIILPGRLVHLTWSKKTCINTL